jgi:xenotropic and polytropic retrovirus receptor 1
LKAISRALRAVNQTPRNWRRGANLFAPSPYDTAPKYSFLNRYNKRPVNGDHGADDLRPVASHNSQTSKHANGIPSSLAREIPRTPEEQPLTANNDGDFRRTGLTRYGSILGSPPDNEGRDTGDDRGRKAPDLELPDPALDIDHASPHPGPVNGSQDKTAKAVGVVPTNTGNAFEVGKTKSPAPQSSSLPFRYKSIFAPKRVNTTPAPPGQRPFMRRVFTFRGKDMPSPEMGDVPLEAYKDLDIRQEEFFRFLDLELEKIESFYKQKEDEATERLKVLRTQLHIMRDKRIEELVNMHTSKLKSKQKVLVSGEADNLLQNHSSEDEQRNSTTPGFKSFFKPVDSALEAVKTGKYGKTSKSMHILGTPSALRPKHFPDDRRDYSRRPDLPDVPYRSAKRKLKVALQEYYRGLELLKAYALLNRTAFRKINKKYDKTVNARPSLRYMTEKVNKAWFVRSDVLEGHIRVVEDLYARYFENGNHKVAAGKLRIKSVRAGEYTQSSFRNGLTLAAGLVFGVQGLVKGAILLSSDDDKLHSDTSYLLQVCYSYPMAS